MAICRIGIFVGINLSVLLPRTNSFNIKVTFLSLLILREIGNER